MEGDSAIMSMGPDLRGGFLELFEHAASNVTVVRNHSSAEEKRMELRAMKNRAKGIDLFQFDEQIDLKLGDLIQQKNSRDVWEVYSVEDKIIGDTFISVEAKVQRLEGATLPPRDSQQSGNVAITVHGPVVGGLQVNSPNSSQNVGLSNVSLIANEVEKLKQLLSDPQISPINREDGQHALDRVNELSKRERSKEVIQRIKEKLDFVKSIFGVAKSIHDVAAPYIDNIYRQIGN